MYARARVCVHACVCVYVCSEYIHFASAVATSNLKEVTLDRMIKRTLFVRGDLSCDLHLAYYGIFCRSN